VEEAGPASQWYRPPHLAADLDAGRSQLDGQFARGSGEDCQGLRSLASPEPSITWPEHPCHLSGSATWRHRRQRSDCNGDVRIELRTAPASDARGLLPSTLHPDRRLLPFAAQMVVAHQADSAVLLGIAVAGACPGPPAGDLGPDGRRGSLSPTRSVSWRTAASASSSASSRRAMARGRRRHNETTPPAAGNATHREDSSGGRPQRGRIRDEGVSRGDPIETETSARDCGCTADGARPLRLRGQGNDVQLPVELASRGGIADSCGGVS
jgi:hypothetical protein